MEVFKSATKIVLMLIIIALIILTFLHIVDPKDFMTIALMVVSFYFGKGTATSPEVKIGNPQE